MTSNSMASTSFGATITEFGGGDTMQSTQSSKGTRQSIRSHFRPHAQRPVERASGRPAHAPRTAAPHDFTRTMTRDENVVRQEREERAARRRQRYEPPVHSSRTFGTQSDYRESEAQTAPYAPDFLLPNRPSSRQRVLNEKFAVSGADGRPEVLTLRDEKYATGEALSSADVVRIEKQRAKRVFEASLPPLSDTKLLPLRRKLMQEWEEAEWAEREREIARVQEERLEVLKAAIDARELEAESVADRRLSRMRAGALEEKRKKFDGLQTKRVRGLRKLEMRRERATQESKTASYGVASVAAGQTVTNYASYASTAYAPLLREGRADPLNALSNRGTDFLAVNRGVEFDDDSRRSALDMFLELEKTIPRGDLDVDRTIRLAEVENFKVTGHMSSTLRWNAEDENENTETFHVAEKKTNAEKAELHYFEQLNKTADTLEASKKEADGERGVGAIWPAPLKDESLEEATRRQIKNKKEIRDAKIDSGPRRVERPETPELEPPLDEMAPEYNAVVLLQRLLRGVAAQNAMHRGIENRRALIDELRADETEDEFSEEEDNISEDDASSVGDPLDDDADEDVYDSEEDARRSHLNELATATQQALQMLSISDSKQRQNEFENMDLFAKLENDKNEAEATAATKIQAAHRRRLERKRLSLKKSYDIMSADVQETSVQESADELTSSQPPSVDVASLSSPELRSVRGVQTAARQFVDREVRLDFMLAEAEAAAADIDATVLDGNEYLRRLQVTARAHVEAVAETRALARVAGVTEEDAEKALVQSPSAKAMQAAARRRLGELQLDASQDESHDTVIDSPSTQVMQTAARRFLEEALGASSAVKLDELKEEDAAKVKRLQASARALVQVKHGDEPNVGRSLDMELVSEVDFGVDYDHLRVARIQAVARGRAARRDAATRREKRDAAPNEEDKVSPAMKLHSSPSSRTDLPSDVRSVKIEADFADTAEEFVGTPQEQAAAVRIQAAHRGAEGRRLARIEKRRRSDPSYGKELARRKTERAAIKIQAAHRGSVARRSVAEMRMQMREEHETHETNEEEEDEEE
ncbi:hypothetical protein N9L76_02545 [bacterium]|nr:hypothetical protein [bacterium]